MVYQRKIENLSLPSRKQIEWFKKHLLSIHSWYKQLSLEVVNQFVIFLEPDLDRNYATNHVIYPWNVNTKEQYLKAYGHLSYMWLDNDIWNQDGGEARTDIPNDLIKRWSVILFPYCHAEFEEAISLLRATLNSEKSEFIPNYTKLSELESKITIRDDYWDNQLIDKERQILVSIDADADDSELENLSTSAKTYVQLERDTWPKGGFFKGSIYIIELVGELVLHLIALSTIFRSTGIVLERLGWRKGLLTFTEDRILIEGGKEFYLKYDRINRIKRLNRKTLQVRTKYYPVRIKFKQLAHLEKTASLIEKKNKGVTQLNIV